MAHVLNAEEEVK